MWQDDDDDNTKKCKWSGDDEDRISNLPDNLIASILSLLPIHSAAATSTLSRRWRYLWTHITGIHLYSYICKNADNYTTTIDYILSQLNSPKITSFTLHLPFTTSSSSVLLLPWIHQICAKSPTLIKIFGCYPGCFLEIPTTPLFQTHSLVILHLDFLSQCEGNSNSNPPLTINLPNLQRIWLCLTLTQSNLDLVTTLFKSCPLLQDLHLQLQLSNDHQPVVVDISAPNLRHLCLIVSKPYNVIRSLQAHKFVIHAPLLETCVLQGNLVFYHFITTPTTLKQVTISSKDLCHPDDNDMAVYHDKILHLFRGICCVKTLILTHWCAPLLCLLSKLDHVAAPPAFPHLISLKIERDAQNRWDWGQIPRLPRCLLANLKSLQVTQLMGTKLEIKMLQHILSNAPVLDHLHISLTNKLRKEYEFCEKLFKTSGSCKIDFSGVAITTSTKDFSDGVLTYRIIRHDHQPLHNTDSDSGSD